MGFGEFVGEEESGGVGEVEHPFADGAGVAVVVADEGCQGSGGGVGVHGEGVAAAVINGTDEAMAVVVAPALGDDAPGAARFADAEAPVDEFVGVVISAQLGVHARGEVGAVGEEDFVEGVVGSVVEELHAPVGSFEVFGVFGAGVGHVFEPGDAGGSVGFFPFAVIDGLHGGEFEGGVIEVGDADVAAHGEGGVVPAVGGDADDLFHAAGVGVALGEGVEEDVGPEFVPEGATGVLAGGIEDEVFAGVDVEVVFGGEDEIVWGVGFVDACDGCAEECAHGVDAFVARAGGFGVTDVGGEAESGAFDVDVGVVPPDEGEEFAFGGEVENELVVVAGGGFPVFDFEGLGEIGHKLDAVDFALGGGGRGGEEGGDDEEGPRQQGNKARSE